jgi:aminopeptidase N
MCDTAHRDDTLSSESILMQRLSLNTLFNYRLATLVAIATLSGIAGAQREERHSYDLQDVSWRMSYDTDKRVIHGQVTNTLVLTERSESVWFDCGQLAIERVTVDGREATSSWSNDRLNVGLPKPSERGARLKVTISYSGSPSAGVYFVAPEHAYPAKTGMVYTQGESEDNRYWLPTYDFPDDKATAECFIDVPAGEFALSNGKLMGVAKTPSTWTYHWRISKPISTYLISFVAGDYSEGKESLGSLPVLWYVPRGTERWGQAAFAGTNRMIDTFNKLTGFNYPFEKFSQSAVADFMFGGMENASCVTQTIHALHKPENEPLANSEGLVAHELAHQWFGDTITCADWSHAWLNEGFASFLPAFWFRKSRGEDEFDSQRLGTFLGALGSQQATKRPVVSHRYEIPMDLFDGQIYGGGAARLFTLMYQIGEKTFWQGVKEYLNEYKFKNATTEDFFKVMSRVSKRDLSTFRDQFFYSSEMPEYKVSRHGSDVVIRQSGSGYDLDLKVSVISGDDVKEVPAHIHGAETIVHANAGPSDLVVLDYGVTAMVRIVYEDVLPTKDLIHIFRLAPNAAAKLIVVSRFSDSAFETDLLEVARAEKSRPVLQAMLPKLPRAAIPYLVQLTRGFDRQLAYSALSALDRFTDDPQAQDRLKEIWTRDSNEFMRDQALRELLSVAKDGSLAEEAWRLNSQDEMFCVSALRWGAEHEPNTARQKCLEVLNGPPNEPLKNEAIRQLGTLKDAPGEHRVFDALMKVAQDPSYSARLAAINSLVGFGDPRVIAVIEPMTKSNLFFARRAAIAALAKLRK